MKIGKKSYRTSDYVLAFSRVSPLAPHHLRMLRAHYYAPKRTLTATQMARIVGYDKWAPANLHYGKLGRIVGKALGWSPLPRVIIGVLVRFEKPGREWHWIMRPAVAAALERLNLVSEQESPIAEEVDQRTTLYEGHVRRIAVNAYERSSAAREKCILHYGCRCAVCGLSLAEKYGKVAQGLIHVHHLRQLAEINAKYQVDPIADLRPVCPTCHSVIHARTPPFTIEQVKLMIAKTRMRRKSRPRP